MFEKVPLSMCFCFEQQQYAFYWMLSLHLIKTDSPQYRIFHVDRPTGAFVLKHTSPIIFINHKVFQSADRRPMIGRTSSDDRPNVTT